jgi:prophage DNA circulation protein
MTATTDSNGVTTLDAVTVTGVSTIPVPDGLQPASWRGIPFGVLTDEGHFGRRVALHEYPYRDTPWIEDLGRATRRINLTGFLVSDSLVYGGGDVLDQLNTMIGAAEMEGSGTLIHPTLGRLTVSCETMATNAHWDQARYYELTFSFIDSGVRAFPSAVVQTQYQTGAAAATMDAAASSDFATAMTPLSSTGEASIDQVVGQSSAWVGKAISLGNDASSLMNLASQLVGPYGRYFNGGNQGAFNALASPYAPSTTIADLAAQGAASRAALAAAGASEIAIAGSLGLPGSLTTDLAAAAQATVAALQATSANPGDALRILGDLQGFASGSSTPIAGAVGDLHRRAAVSALARASANYQPTSGDDAVNVRMTVTAALDAEIQIAGAQGADNSYNALRTLRVAVVQDMQARGAGLGTLIAYNFQAPLPAPMLANMLYRDATRADELVTEADPIHPLFMPLAFLALAQ